MKPSDRRKFLAELIPYMISEYWDVGQKLDPFALLSQVLHDYGEESQKLLADRSFKRW